MAKLKTEIRKGTRKISHKIRRVAKPLHKSNMHKKLAEHTFARAKDQFTNSAETAYLGAQEVVLAAEEEIMNRSTDALDNVESYVRDKPIKALGWAALSGAALAFLFKH